MEEVEFFEQVRDTRADGRARIKADEDKRRAAVEAELSKIIPPAPGLNDIKRNADHLTLVMQTHLKAQLFMEPDNPCRLEYFRRSEKPRPYTGHSLYLPKAGVFDDSLWWRDICEWGKKVEDAWEPKYAKRADACMEEVARAIQSIWEEKHPHFRMAIVNLCMDMTISIPKAVVVERQGKRKKLKILE